jgi:poly(A) polymerase
VETAGIGVSDGLVAARSLQTAVEAIVEPVFLVGGSVRDLLMGRPCGDYDFATSRTPDEVDEAVRGAGRRPYLAGKRFGTVGFKIGGHTVEVTTFRAETYVDGSRRPDVRYLDDLGDDLARRDFTINAIALHGDALIDPHGGRADITARIVRTVGDPEERFAEDPLRLLRAARFVSQLTFDVEPATQSGMAENAHRILSVARERRASELDKLLVGPAAVAGLRLLSQTGLVRYLLPELQPLTEEANGAL